MSNINNQWRDIYLCIMELHHLDDNTRYREDHHQFLNIEGIREVAYQHGMLITSRPRMRVGGGVGMAQVITIDIELEVK